MGISTVEMRVLMQHCEVCHDKRYLIMKRDDGRYAVERCDNCAVDYLNDEQAAARARKDGVRCAHQYPCYIQAAS